MLALSAVSCWFLSFSMPCNYWLKARHDMLSKRKTTEENRYVVGDSTFDQLGVRLCFAKDLLNKKL